MLFVVGDLTHADVLNVLVFALLDDHAKVRLWVEQTHWYIVRVLSFPDLLEARNAHKRAFSLSSTTLLDFGG